MVGAMEHSQGDDVLPSWSKCWVHLAGISLLVKWPGQGSEPKVIQSSDCVPISLSDARFTQH